MRRVFLIFSLLILVFSIFVTSSFGSGIEQNSTGTIPKIALSSYVQDNTEQWQTRYDEVIKTLSSQKFLPGRILCKPEGKAEFQLRTFDPRVDMAYALNFARHFLYDIDENGTIRSMEFCQPDYMYSVTDTQVKPLGNSLATNNQFPASVTGETFPNDPWFAKYQSPYLRAIGMPKVWDKFGFNYEAANSIPIVNVVDTGIYCADQYDANGILTARKHPDLDFNQVVCREDYVPEDPILHWHASAVTATIAAITNNNHGGSGIAPPFTRIQEWRVCDSHGICSTWSIAEAINQITVESNGLGNEVINISLGGPSADPVMKTSISLAVSSKKIIFVAASGNDGTASVSFPAAFPDVIAAGAATFGNPRVRASYSNYGPELAVVAPVGDTDQDADNNGVPDGVVVEMFLTDPTQYDGYVVNGTSFAAPQVVGEIAWLISQGVLGPDAIRKRVTGTADDLLTPGFDNETGWGMIRVDNALLGTIVPQPPPPPPPPIPTADIKANGSDGLITINYNTSATISWSSTNASTCSVSPTGWSGTSNAGISTGNLTSSVTYILTCTGDGGRATDSVTINVLAPPPPPPPTPPSRSDNEDNSFCHRHPNARACRQF